MIEFGDGPHLLIVEDDPAFRALLSKYYEMRGLSVVGAGSLVSARAKLAKHAFDVVLLDVQLPDGDGLSLLGLVPPERALTITSSPDPRRFARLGIRHVQKPFDLATLTREVERILELGPIGESPRTSSPHSRLAAR